jgi:hypothetical protein
VKQAEKIVAVSVLVLFAFLLSPEDATSISGKVVDAITGAPLGKVQLRLEPISETSRQPVSATASDSKGEFSFVGVEPGLYHLTGTRSGYLPAAYGAKRPDAPGTTIRIEPGQKVEPLTLSMKPFGVIAGTVRDREGEPQSGVQVRLNKWRYDARYNVRRPSWIDEARTDDLGQYRFANLSAGRYYLLAEPVEEVNGIVDRSGVERHLEVDVRTFYPGVYEPSAATPVELGAGQRSSGVDITLVRTKVYRIRGQAGSESGVPPPTRVGLLLGRLDAFWFALSGERVTDGAFEFPAVPPGTYTLTASSTQGQWRYEASTPVTVGAADLEGIRVIVRPGAEVTGKIAADGEGKLPFSSFDLAFVCEGREYGSNLDSAGSFAAYLYPGRCRIHFHNSSSDASLYLKSARVGEQDALSQGLTISDPGKVRLDLVVSKDSGVLEGTAAGSDYKSVPGATVLLTPLDISVTADQNGHFEFKGVPPGEYRVLAFDDIEPGGWLDADFSQGRESQGEKITVRAKQKSVVRVQISSPASK